MPTPIGNLGDVTKRSVELLAAADVVAVEMDKRCIPALEELSTAFDGALRIVEGDARKVDVPSLIGEGPYHILSNLPYNVGTLLLTDWLSSETWPPQWQSLTLMFQQEVAESILAGIKAYFSDGATLARLG